MRQSARGGPAPAARGRIRRTDHSEETSVTTTDDTQRSGVPHRGRPQTDGPLADVLLDTGRFFRRGTEYSDDKRSINIVGGRDGDIFYRDRWSHDKVVRSTHGVNCTGSCSWKIYVKDGIITWETQ